MNKCVLCIVVLFLLTGCFGVIADSPKECPETIKVRRAWEASGTQNTKEGMPTKKDFLNSRGEPDEIMSISANLETWLYKEKEWCGFWVGYGAIFPLMLPVCNSVDYITFKDEEVFSTRVTETKDIGFMGAAFLGGKFVNEDSCGPEEMY